MNNGARNQRGPTPLALLAGNTHPEAYCLMTYATADRTLIEVLWNSRDGVTPFIVAAADGREMRHIDWHRDAYAPHHRPAPGQRVFVDRSRAAAEALAVATVERCWERPEFPLRAGYPSREAAIAALAAEYHGDGHQPRIVAVRADGTWEG